MPRWVCTECGTGKNGPQRPRMDNVIRYCLPCSEKQGVLVKRVAPALEKKRAASASRSRDKAAAKRDKQRAADTWGGIHIPTEAKKIWRLLKPYHKGTKALPPIRIRKRSDYSYSGHCKFGDEVVLSMHPDLDPSDVWGLLAHELVHEVRRNGWSGDRRTVHDERFYTILTDLTYKRFGVRVPMHKLVGRFGYQADRLTCGALWRAGLAAVDGKPMIDTALAAKRKAERAAREQESEAA